MSVPNIFSDSVSAAVFYGFFCLFSCLFDQHLTTLIFSGRHAPVCTYEPRNVSELERAGGFDACLHVCKA